MTGFQNGKALAAAAPSVEFRAAEQHTFDEKRQSGNAIACGDNLAYMAWLLRNGYAGKVKCVYIDPPFFTKAKYSAVVDLRDADGHKHKLKHLAYDDTFERDLEHYVTNITARLILIRELLADDGLIWMHLDWHSSHYIRIIMDEVFGTKNFINEIVWKYKSGGSGKRHFSRKHDSILLYAKTPAYRLRIPQEKSYNRGLKPYKFKGVKEYKDDYGWYTMVNMKDVWSIDMVGRTSRERTGYATQKPLELMKRIVESSTDEGDLCADFFCGSGSFLDACDTLGRRWIGCDSEEMAVGMTKRRLDSIKATYTYYLSTNDNHYHDGLTMRMLSSEELESGKRMYRYTVDSFTPDIDYGHIPLNDRAVVERIATDNPTSLIECIMIDPDTQDAFTCGMTVEGCPEEILFLSHGDAAFVAVDAFGKEYYYSSRQQ